MADEEVVAIILEWWDSEYVGNDDGSMTPEEAALDDVRSLLDRLRARGFTIVRSTDEQQAGVG